MAAEDLVVVTWPPLAPLQETLVPVPLVRGDTEARGLQDKVSVPQNSTSWPVD